MKAFPVILSMSLKVHHYKALEHQLKFMGVCLNAEHSIFLSVASKEEISGWGRSDNSQHRFDRQEKFTWPEGKRLNEGLFESHGVCSVIKAILRAVSSCQNYTSDTNLKFTITLDS